MKIWHWLTEPTHIPLFVAIIGFLSAIIGGVIGQVIAGLFKRSGDTRALSAAAENAKAAELRWEREQSFERQKLLIALQRESFARFLLALNTLDDAQFELVIARKGSLDAVFELIKATFATAVELELYDKDIAAEARQLIKSFPNTKEIENDKDKYLVQRNAWKQSLVMMRAHMRDALGLAEITVEAHNQRQPYEAPLSGKKQIEPGESSTNPT